MNKIRLFIIIVILTFFDLITSIFFNKIILLKYLILFLSLLYLFIIDKRKIKGKVISLSLVYFFVLIGYFYLEGKITPWYLTGTTTLFLLIYELINLFKLDSKQRKKINEKKITILVLHLGYGGIEKYISSLCKMLENNYRIEIISTYKVLNKPAFEFSKKVKIKYLIDGKPNREEFKQSIKDKNIINIIKEGIKAIKLIYKKESYNIDAIENIDSKYIITTRDFHNELVGIYGRSDSIKIATEHNYHNDNKRYIKKVVKSVKYMNYFILVSEELKDFYKTRVNPLCVYIPNIIDDLPDKTSKCDNHTLISVGRLSKEKGQLDLIDVVKLIKEEVDDVKLYLVGDGQEKDDIIEHIKHNELDKEVILTGFLSKKEIESKMLESSVFVTTSHTESFGLAVLEACSYKLPVVAFDSANGIKCLLKDDCGILISNRDKEKMKEEIIKLFNENNYRKKISNNGYKNCKNYLPSNVRKMWLDILKRGIYEEK